MGLLSRAQHLTLSMSKKYGKSWGCSLHMPDIVWSHDEKCPVAKNNNHKKGLPLIIPGVLEMMWELDESLLCQSLVYIKSPQVANGCNQSGEKAHQTEQNQSKFNINTANTFADAAARSSCLQTEQVLQHRIKSLSPSLNKDTSCWATRLYSTYRLQLLLK